MTYWGVTVATAHPSPRPRPARRRVLPDQLRSDRAGPRRRPPARGLPRARRARGWTVTAVFTDNDISAFSGKRGPATRPCSTSSAPAVLGRRGLAPDRLHRRRGSWRTSSRLVEAHGVTVETVRAGRHDFTTANGRLMARLTGAVARIESEQKSERVTRALAQRARRRATRRAPPATAGVACTRRRDVPVRLPTAAAVVREVADRIVARGLAAAIASDLTGGACPPPDGADGRKGRGQPHRCAGRDDGAGLVTRDATSRCGSPRGGRRQRRLAADLTVAVGAGQGHPGRPDPQDQHRHRCQSTC